MAAAIASLMADADRGDATARAALFSRLYAELCGRIPRVEAASRARRSSDPA